jgi:hypothetical protein
VASYEQTLVVNLPAHAAAGATQATCRSVVGRGGWKVVESSPYRAVFRSTGMNWTGNTATIEVVVSAGSVRLTGSMFGGGPIIEAKLRSRVGEFTAALSAILGGQVWAGPARGSLELAVERQLDRVTCGWTSLLLVRQYKDDKAGVEAANTEGSVLARHGYSLAGQSGDGGHLNLGTLAMTGGLGAAMGLGRTKGKITLTFQKR